MALLTRIKANLAIHTRRKVPGLLDGEYASTVTGRSLDFSDLREYVAGDDVKDLDWKATARHGTPLVKRYVADRRRTMMLVMCSGAGMSALANHHESKADVALMAAGLMGYLATRHGDYVGLTTTDGAGTMAMRPSSREIELERMLQAVQSRCTPEAGDGSLIGLLEFTVATLKRRSILVLVLEDVPVTGRLEVLVRRLAVQHEVFVIVVPEVDLHGEEPALLRDVSSGSIVPRFVREDRDLARQLARADKERAERRQRLFTTLGIPCVTIRSTDEVVPAIIRLLGRSRHAVRR